MGIAEITYARKLIFISIVFLQNMFSLLDSIENELQSFIELLLPITTIGQSSKAKSRWCKGGKIKVKNRLKIAKKKYNRKQRNETNIPINTRTMTKCRNIYDKSSLHKVLQEILTLSLVCTIYSKKFLSWRNSTKTKFHKVQPCYNLTSYPWLANPHQMWL